MKPPANCRTYTDAVLPAVLHLSTALCLGVLGNLSTVFDFLGALGNVVCNTDWTGLTGSTAFTALFDFTGLTVFAGSTILATFVCLTTSAVFAGLTILAGVTGCTKLVTPRVWIRLTEGTLGFFSRTVSHEIKLAKAVAAVRFCAGNLGVSERWVRATAGRVIWCRDLRQCKVCAAGRRSIDPAAVYAATVPMHSSIEDAHANRLPHRILYIFLVPPVTGRFNTLVFLPCVM